MTGFSLHLRPRGASLEDLAQALLWQAAAGWLLPAIEAPEAGADLLPGEVDAGDRTLFDGPIATPTVLAATASGRATTFWCALAVRLPGAPPGARKPTLRMGAPSRRPLCALELAQDELRLHFGVQGAPFAVPPTRDEAWRQAAEVATDDLARALGRLDADVELRVDGLAPSALAPLRHALGL